MNLKAAMCFQFMCLWIIRGKKKSINSSDLYKTDVQKFSRVELVKEGIGQGFK